MVYHIEHDYSMASAIREQRIREAEHDRLAAVVRAARRALRGAVSQVETIPRVQPAVRDAA